MNKPLITSLALTLCLLCTHTFGNSRGGARALSLSNATVSLADTWSTAHNQATLHQLRRFSAGVSHELLFGLKELSTTSLSLVLPVESGTFGCYLRQFGQGGFNEKKIGVAYARKISSRFGMGTQFDYLSSNFPGYSRNYILTIELGCIYSPNSSTGIAFHTFNPVNAVFSKGFPTLQTSPTYRFGGHYRPDRVSLFCMEILHQQDRPLLYRTGLELNILNEFQFRMGVAGKPYHLNFGIGFPLGRLQTDIACSYFSHLGMTPAISIQYQR